MSSYVGGEYEFIYASPQVSFFTDYIGLKYIYFYLPYSLVIQEHEDHMRLVDIFALSPNYNINSYQIKHKQNKKDNKAMLSEAEIYDEIISLWENLIA